MGSILHDTAFELQARLIGKYEYTQDGAREAFRLQALRSPSAVFAVGISQRWCSAFASPARTQAGEMRVCLLAFCGILSNGSLTATLTGMATATVRILRPLVEVECMQALKARTPHDLRDLEPDGALQGLGSTPFGSLAFLDSAFGVIGDGPDTIDLCQVVGPANFGENACNRCPVREKACGGTTDLVQELCIAGVWRTVAPILVHSETIGFVSAPQYPESKFFKLDRSSLSEEVRKIVDQRWNKGCDRGALRDEVKKVAQAISERCLRLRRQRILRDTTEQLFKVQNEKDLVSILLGAIEMLLGKGSESLLCKSVPGATPPKNVLIEARGGHAIDESYELDAGLGHIGKVIESRQPRYEPALSSNDSDYFRSSPGPLPISVFTVPLPWGPSAAAIQIRSEFNDAFSERDREAAELLVGRAGNAATRFFESEERSLALVRSGVREDWDEFLVKILLRQTNSPFEFLAIRHRYYERFAQELYVHGGLNCIATSFRILNSRLGFLGYAACHGPAWTQDAKDTIYTDRTKALGWDALRQTEPIYIHDTALTPDYALLPGTRSAWAKAIHLHGEARGVVTVSWKSVNAGSVGVLDELEHLTKEFEEVLKALSAREEALFRELESSFAGPASIPDIGRRLCDRLSKLFNARACSLFLDSDRSGKFFLSASTHPGSSENLGTIYYEPGVGITGWVAKHRRSVRLRDTANPEERAKVGALHGIVEAIAWREHFSESIDYSDAPGHNSFLAAPLVARDRVLGVIRLTIKNDLSAFTPEDETFLQEVADRLAQALDAIWRDEEANERIQKSEQNAQLVEKLGNALSLRAICKTLAQEMFLGTRAAGVYIRVVDEFSHTTITESIGLFKILQAEGLELPVFSTSSLTSDVWAEPAWANICEAVKDAFGPDAEDRLKSGAALHLERAPYGCYGSIGITWNDSDHGSAEWEKVCHGFMERASPAINRGVKEARLQVSLDRKLNEVTRLREIGLEFNLQSDLKALMISIIRVALKEASMDRGMVQLYDSDKKLWSLMAATDTATEVEVPANIESDLTLGRCLEDARPVVTAGDEPEWLDHIRSLPSPTKAFLAQERIRLAVPLKLSDKFIGAILLSSLNEARSPAPDTIEYLEVLSQYASFAIHSAQLHQKEIELAQPFALMGAMSAGFLHVMGNKLHNAWATFSNLSDPLLPESERAQKIDNLRYDLDRITEIYRDLGNFFSPGRAASRHPVDLNNLVDKAWNDSSGPRSENMRLTSIYTKPAPIVHGNEMQLEIAIRMLIQNAVEAITDAGGIWLQTKKTDRSIIVRVADSGAGMDRETLGNCTRPFFTTKGNSGTGLGLAVVLGIVIRHKGKLRIHSKPGKGSIFSLVFPK